MDISQILITIVIIIPLSIWIILTLVEYYLVSSYRHEKTNKLIPGPSLLYLASRILFSKAHLSQEIKRINDQFGDIFHCFTANRSAIILAHPKYADKVLLDSKEMYPKIDILLSDKLCKFWGQNVLIVNGANWKHQRNVMNPAFYDISKFVPIFGEKGRICIEEWESEYLKKSENHSKVFDVKVKQWMQQLTLDVLGKTVFGYEFRYLEGKSHESLEAYNCVMRQAFNIYRTLVKAWYYLPLASNREFDRANEKFEKLVLDMIKKCKKRVEEKVKNGEIVNEEELKKGNVSRSDILKEKSKESLLELMIDSQFEGNKLTDKQLRDNIIVFFIAGHETSAYTLSFMLYELSRNVDVQEKARKEVYKVMGDDAKWSDVPTYEQLKQMDYLDWVINETMRVYPPISILNARLQQDNKVIGGYKLPKNTIVSVFVYGIHHNKKVWGDPEKFRPERFSPEESKGRPSRAFIPFSAGMRVCIGKSFAMAEIKLFLCMILRRYELIQKDSNTGTPDFTWSNLVISPSDSMTVRFKVRE